MAQTNSRMKPAAVQNTRGSVGMALTMAEATELPEAPPMRDPRDSPVVRVETRSRMKAALSIPASRGTQYIGSSS